MGAIPEWLSFSSGVCIRQIEYMEEPVSIDPRRALCHPVMTPALLNKYRADVMTPQLASIKDH